MAMNGNSNGNSGGNGPGRPPGPGQYTTVPAGLGLNLPRPTGGHDLKRLREVHHLILRIAALGTLTNKEIADLLGVTEAMVGYTINSELGQQKMAVLRGEADSQTIDILQEYMELAPLAVQTMEDIMLSAGEKAADRLRAAEGILGGAGYGKRERIDVYQHHITDEDIAEARRRSREKGLAAGLIVDAVVLSSTPDDSDREGGDAADEGGTTGADG